MLCLSMCMHTTHMPHMQGCLCAAYKGAEAKRRAAAAAVRRAHDLIKATGRRIVLKRRAASD